MRDETQAPDGAAGRMLEAVRRSIPVSALPALLAMVAGAAVVAGESGIVRRRTWLARWRPPACEAVAGTPGVAFSIDRGATLVRSSEPLAGVAYTYGLLALREPDHLLAVHQGLLLRSTDAGCTWTELTHIGIDRAPARLRAGAGPFSWAWSQFGTQLVRITQSSVTVVGGVPAGLAGVGADPADAAKVRIALNDGSILASSDGGGHWSTRGRLASTRFVFRVDFDPADPDHAVAGTMTDGAFATFDGGATWTRATGLSVGGGPVNLPSVAISPADGRTVWAAGIDVDQADAGAPSMGRHIYRSADGGLTFAPVLDHSPPGVTITNEPLLAPDPRSPGVVLFAFGTAFQRYGTDLYELDADRGSLTRWHHDVDDITAIAFSPGDPHVLWLGLASERAVDAAPDGAPR